MEEKLDKLHDGVLGTMSEPGLKNTIYNTHEAVEKLTARIDSIQTSQQQLLDQKNFLSGAAKSAIWLVGLVSGFISWLATTIFNKN